MAIARFAVSSLSRDLAFIKPLGFGSPSKLQPLSVHSSLPPVLSESHAAAQVSLRTLHRRSVAQPQQPSALLLGVITCGAFIVLSLASILIYSCSKRSAQPAIEDIEKNAAGKSRDSDVRPRRRGMSPLPEIEFSPPSPTWKPPLPSVALVMKSQTQRSSPGRITDYAGRPVHNRMAGTVPPFPTSAPMTPSHAKPHCHQERLPIRQQPQPLQQRSNPHMGRNDLQTAIVQDPNRLSGLGISTIDFAAKKILSGTAGPSSRHAPKSAGPVVAKMSLTQESLSRTILSRAEQQLPPYASKVQSATIAHSRAGKPLTAKPHLVEGRSPAASSHTTPRAERNGAAGSSQESQDKRRSKRRGTTLIPVALGRSVGAASVANHQPSEGVRLEYS